MRVYLATVDYFFVQGLTISCQMEGIPITVIPLSDIEHLNQYYPLQLGDTLILALDEFKGDFLLFLSYIPILRALNIKVILVSDSFYHLRHVGGYLLSKTNPFSEYLQVIRHRWIREINFIRHRYLLNARDYLILGAFYRGFTSQQVATLLGGASLKMVSTYKQQALRKLGVNHFNHLYQIF
ncbi:helix-turn-helix transcriptional regulator [Hafnia sp.]|uniref:helix-turn-helix transcriptional regulator n=1 Tax=Hafnia sp. TaxID=1873498 RepID=UPI002FCA9D1C